MKNRVLCALLFLTFALSAPLFGQTAAKLEALLETRVLSWGEAAAFIMEAADVEDPGTERWLPKNASLGDTAKLGGVALLLMQSFEIKGGVFYTITNSQHHAFRELTQKEVIRRHTEPNTLVSGQQLLLMVNRILTMRGE